MKSTYLIIIMLCTGLCSHAQNAKITEVRVLLSQNNYRDAILLINEAVKNNDTKNNAEAWYLRGMAYLQQAIDTTIDAPAAATDSYNSLMKALILKPDYGTEINNGLYSNALLSFNKGVKAFQSNSTEAYYAFKQVIEIYQINKGKRFAENENFSALAKSARLNAAYSAINANKRNEALLVFNEIRNLPGTKDTNVYQMLVEIYQSQQDDAQLLSVLREARREFPANAQFRNQELNYYIRKGDTMELLPKLEEATKADPQNAELFFNLGNTYYRSLFPKDAAGKEKQRPVNFSGLFNKGVNAYQQAIQLQPARADYSYNLGILYYEVAASLTKEMNLITGKSEEENKKYDDLLAQRNEHFNLALPYFESAYHILDPKLNALSTDEKITYQNTLTGLREIYSRRKDDAKAGEMKAKLDKLRKQ